MKVSVLFSGGKDSGLSTIIMEPFFPEMEMVTFTFGVDDAWKVAERAAEALGHPHRAIRFPREVLETGLEMLHSHGYPNDALNYVHSFAVESLAKESDYVVDGTRRDDRAPIMSPGAVRSLEDRYHMNYIRPLAGWGWKTINEMASRHMEFEVCPSDKYPAADFEVGLRYALANQYGESEVDRIFPSKHTHSRVVRRKRVE
ncbi:MAG: hypothetical protein JW986_10870 [Methanotrichaceae archaeon]|nr:hypothetical protein [Methanotrichaceae archaeon]